MNSAVQGDLGEIPKNAGVTVGAASALIFKFWSSSKVQVAGGALSAGMRRLDVGGTSAGVA